MACLGALPEGTCLLSRGLHYDVISQMDIPSIFQLSNVYPVQTP